MKMRICLVFLSLCISAGRGVSQGLPETHQPTVPADAVYRSGYVYTVDAKDSVQQALAVRDGKIVYVGSDTGVKSFIGKDTKVTDLQGRMLMPGLIDGHMHPLAGGTVLLKCNLNYERLTIAQMQAKVQQCLDQSKDQEPNGWLEVVNWFQEAMLPAGTVTNSAVLDSLHTRRPIFVLSSFGHTGLAIRGPWNWHTSQRAHPIRRAEGSPTMHPGSHRASSRMPRTN